MREPMVQVFQVTHAEPGQRVDALTAKGLGHGGAADDALEVVESPGLRSRPAVRGTTEALVLELAGGDRFAFIIDKGAKEGELPAGSALVRRRHLWKVATPGDRHSIYGLRYRARAATRRRSSAQSNVLVCAK